MNGKTKQRFFVGQKPQKKFAKEDILVAMPHNTKDFKTTRNLCWIVKI